MADIMPVLTLIYALPHSSLLFSFPTWLLLVALGLWPGNSKSEISRTQEDNKFSTCWP